MSILHTVPAGLPTGTVAGKVAGDDWRADHDHVPFSIDLMRATSAQTLTASAAVNSEILGTPKSTRTVIDLTTATEVRLVIMGTTNGSTTTAAIKLSYMTTNNATWTNNDAGPSCIVGASTTGTLRDSGWVSLAAGARIANCYLALVVGAAFGTTPPAISSATVFFR